MTGPKYVDKGLVTRAMKLMCSYGFKALGLHPVSLRVASYNPGPSEPWEKAGFNIEGSERDSHFHDELIVGIVDCGYFAS